MGAMNWFRWHHGTSDDPKFRALAEDSGQPLVAVLAVWAKMLETASVAEERGRLLGWRDRVVAAGLCITEDAVASIRQAMQGLVLDGDRLTGWQKRQPEREDPSASERQRRHRAAQATGGAVENSVSRPVTQAHAPERESDSEEIHNPPVAAREADVVSIEKAGLNSGRNRTRADARAGSAAASDGPRKAIVKERWRQKLMAEAHRTMPEDKVAALWMAQMQDPIPAWALAELERIDRELKRQRKGKPPAGAVAARRAEQASADLPRAA